MILMDQVHLDSLVASAEAAYPEESCGLLEGVCERELLRVTRVHPSKNVALLNRSTRFEVDPSLILRLQRELRDGPTGIVAVYHSHPSGLPRPSDTDLASALDPGKAWFITAVVEGRAETTAAFLLVGKGASARFEEIKIEVESEASSGKGSFTASSPASWTLGG